MGMNGQSPKATRVRTAASRPSCLRRFSSALVEALERVFFRWGYAVGRFPWIFIVVCVAVVGVCGTGIIFMSQENREEALWVPLNSQAKKDKTLVDRKFPSKTRYETMVVSADNVLTPRILQAMLDIDKKVKAIKKPGHYDWKSICAKMSKLCWSNNILELWSFNESVIASLTQQDILDTINTVSYSPVYHNEYDVTKMLGKIERDKNGKIIGAEATILIYFIEDNSTLINGQEIDERALEWELQFIDIGKAGHRDIRHLYVYAKRSFDDEGVGTVFKDVNLLTIGYSVIILFVAMVLGKFNMVQQRIYISFCGVMCIAFAMIVAFGLSSYCGVFVGPPQAILPFLLLGIGVDDMFVIIQALENLGPDANRLHSCQRIGLMMKHAGMSITVTSITDIVAFGIGATTILPALRSFCVYACIGIFATFMCQTTFFVACITLDERRVSANRNACCCCYIHKNYKPNQCSQRSLVQYVFERYYAPILVKLPVKIVVLVVTLGMLGVNLWGVTKLQQEMDPVWFLPSNSYAYQFIQANKKYFPEDGISTSIYLGKIDYYGKYQTLEDLHFEVSKNEYTYKGTVDSWFYSFRKWLNNTSNPAVTFLVRPKDRFPRNKELFYKLLRLYIFQDPTSGGLRFAKDIKFSETVPLRVLASRITFKHRNLANSKEQIAAMESIRDVAHSKGFAQADCFPYTRLYMTYEGNQVIQQELYRNLGLAFISVAVMTLVMIANVRVCTLVCTCVIMTLVDVGGMMYFWGVTIEIVSSIILILAIGLAVDYAAHIGHYFMTETGTKDARVEKTVGHMAPAVFYGGFSTFLAFVLLVGSTSYVFRTFFKVFFGVVVFGLWHGLAYLLVMLSWLGPKPYLSAEESKDHRRNTQDLSTVTGSNVFQVQDEEGPSNNIALSNL